MLLTRTFPTINNISRILKFHIYIINMKNIEIYSSIYSNHHSFYWRKWPSTSLQIIYAGPGGIIMAITMKEKAEVLKNNPALNNILVNNDWEWTGILTYGRSGEWLNIYWYSYKGEDDSPTWISDKEIPTQIMMFKIWDRKREEYTNFGILPDGNFVRYAGRNSNHPWGFNPGTYINCESYRVWTLKELMNGLGLNGYEALELIALRCACY